VTQRSARFERLVLTLANVLGRILRRPSDTLLSELAARDRRGSSPQADSPLVAASHKIQLGQAAFASGAYGEALHHFGAALEDAPEAPWAWHGRGDALQLSGQHEAALSAYDEATRINPQCGLHQAGRANALAAMGRKEDAHHAWENALLLDSSLTWMRDGSKND
jgi:tetratricopeptide (TPR) repeat protein